MLNFGVNVMNSIKVAVPTALVAVVLSILGAYAVARLNFRGKDALLNGILMIYLFPGVLLIIPLFAMLAQIGTKLGFDVQDNLAVLIVTYLAQTLPVALYMLANYFRTIPAEIEQAGLIDGCTRMQVIWRITLPLAIPALVSVAIYTFMIAWNEFLFALTLTRTNDMRTVPIGIQLLMGQHSYEWNQMMAMSVLGCLPVLILFLLFQRYFLAGMSAGAIKG